MKHSSMNNKHTKNYVLRIHKKKIDDAQQN